MTRRKLLEGKVSIITGGSMGLGKAIALTFAKEGSHLVLASRTKSYLEATKQELECFGSRAEIFPTDVSKPEEVKDLRDFTLAKFTTIDILVNDAGIHGPLGPMTDSDTDKWIYAVRVNLVGTFLCSRAVLPTMIQHRKGKIINLSGGGATSPRPFFSAYSASKAAVVRLTETLAEEVAEFNIQVNTIAPGAMNTRLLDEIAGAGAAAGPKSMQEVAQQLQTGGTPLEKPAALALFLASEESNGLTGRVISSVWDDWRTIPQHLPDIMSSDIYTMRRIIPKDRGYNW